jgi:hypothetical protein
MPFTGRDGLEHPDKVALLPIPLELRLRHGHAPVGKVACHVDPGVTTAGRRRPVRRFGVGLGPPSLVALVRLAVSIAGLHRLILVVRYVLLLPSRENGPKRQKILETFLSNRMIVRSAGMYAA